jgi:glycosyltransferase involved in cell wall biosynthesis
MNPRRMNDSTITVPMPSQKTLARVAVVQHGDYAQARQLMDEGKPEIYTGQRYTIQSFDHFFGTIPHLIISREGDTPPTERGVGQYACVRFRRIPGIPTRFSMHWAANRILSQIKRFAPTHVLLRCSDLIGCRVLRWANQNRIPAAVITAMRFEPGMRDCVEFCRLANDDNVGLVANHLPAATESMLAAGLRPGKAIAYDFPPSVRPEDHPAKPAPAAGREVTALFVGVMSEPKGTLDFLGAGERLRAAGRKIRLVFLGDGPARAKVTSHAGVAEGWIVSPGRVGHDYVLEQMRKADIQVVPSRPEFLEGMPFVIAEGLATRTPLVISDHPIFVKYFLEGQGVAFYPAGDQQALADKMARILDDPAEYQSLSEASAAAWQSFQVPTKFHDLLDRLSLVWGLR